MAAWRFVREGLRKGCIRRCHSRSRQPRLSAFIVLWLRAMSTESKETKQVEPEFELKDLHFVSRRSPVLCVSGAVASSQPLASEIGLSILKAGGNAVDACVAIAAALNVTEPCSTGIGGDCFALFYNAKTKKVEGMNGSGRCPAGLSLAKLQTDMKLGATDTLPPYHIHTVTVPGAAAGWVDAIAKWGKLKLGDVLAPAIKLAETGFPVAPIVAHSWAKGIGQLKQGPHAAEMLFEGRAPVAGEIFKNPNLANTFKLLASKGKDGFYSGPVAEAIVTLSQQLGGAHTLEVRVTWRDLKAHETTFDAPISTTYKGVEVYEIPPNGQGITALMALNVLEGLGVEKLEHNGAQYLHTLIEAMRIAFADTRWYVADPSKVRVPTAELLSKDYAAKRRSLFNPKKASVDVKHGSPFTSSDTVSFCCVDGEGNACSFINSNYMGFGTGLIPQGCGFTLQNRGHNFSLNPEHSNCLAPNKRPYHTIIPGMATKNGELYCPFSVMGGFMQPQGHVQVLLNMIDFGMNPQEALDMPRFCIESGEAGGHVLIEDGISKDTLAELKAMGHDARPVASFARSVFGRGQIIRKAKNGALWCGSDGRADGCAMGY